MPQESAGAEDGVLRAPHLLEFPYLRSVGPVIGSFLTGLREGRITGVSGAGDSVIVPPTEYDPLTSEETGESVDVGPQGSVTTWAWVSTPLPDQPLDRPFAWALVKLDGATTSMLHIVDVGSPEQMRSGMRVLAKFRPSEQRVGHIRDIECFVPFGDH